MFFECSFSISNDQVPVEFGENIFRFFFVRMPVWFSALDLPIQATIRFWIISLIFYTIEIFKLRFSIDHANISRDRRATGKSRKSNKVNNVLLSRTYDVLI